MAVNKWTREELILAFNLYFKIPFGIETVEKVPVERQLKMEFGFRTEEAGERTQFSKRGFQEESLMLTGDLNAAEVEWIVQFRIADPYKFLFKVRNASQTFGYNSRHLATSITYAAPVGSDVTAPGPNDRAGPTRRGPLGAGREPQGARPGDDPRGQGACDAAVALDFKHHDDAAAAAQPRDLRHHRVPVPADVGDHAPQVRIEIDALRIGEDTGLANRSLRAGLGAGRQRLIADHLPATVPRGAAHRFLQCTAG